MTESWDKMRKAKEEDYFERKNKEALERLAHKKQSDDSIRMSPVSGEPMEKVVIHGVVIDRCVQSGGIWLDAGELEQILQATKDDENVAASSWVVSFFKTLTGK